MQLAFFGYYWSLQKLGVSKEKLCVKQPKEEGDLLSFKDARDWIFVWNLFSSLHIRGLIYVWNLFTKQENLILSTGSFLITPEPANLVKSGHGQEWARI